MTSERTNLKMLYTVWIQTRRHSGKGKTMKTVKRSVVAMSLVGREGGMSRIFTGVKLFCMI